VHPDQGDDTPTDTPRAYAVSYRSAGRTGSARGKGCDESPEPRRLTKSRTMCTPVT